MAAELRDQLAARSKSSCSAAFSICSVRWSLTWRLRPERKSIAMRTCSAYASRLTKSTQGAVQRSIWYCRHGRVRLRKKLSRQLRTRNTFSTSARVSRTLPALG